MSRVENTRRRLPYPGAGASLFVPEDIWGRSLEVLRLYGAMGSEGLVFWGGIVGGETIQVTGLYILGHDAQGGHVKVSEEEGRWLVRRLRERDEKLVAQFHSHGMSADHSLGDDERAASSHEGFVSIIAPRFGRGVATPAQCGVHEYSGGRFRRLSDAEAEERIRVARLVEERRAIESPPRRWQWLITLVSSLRRKLIG